MRTSAALIVLTLCLAPQLTGSARAQVAPGAFRLSLDTDIIGFAGVHIEPDGPTPNIDATVFSIGPNQLGGSRLVRPATPLGLGFGYTVTGRVLFGLRVGLGYDVISYDGGRDDEKLLALSLMPGLTFVPFGREAKLFIQVSPLLQIDRSKQGDRKDRVLLGGMSMGLGVLVFAGNRTSIDLGGFFEGRWGNEKIRDEVGGAVRTNTTADVRDLRGVLRFGLSWWR